jgi:membrane protease YdiL (CAAX protease family)
MGNQIIRNPFYTSPVFYGLLALGLLGFVLPLPGYREALHWLVAMAIVEELAFRGVLQPDFDRWLKGRRIGPISYANVICSVLFAAAHLFRLPPEWAATTFFPSLVFGYAWDRWRSVIPSILIHLVYNVLYYFQPV